MHAHYGYRFNFCINASWRTCEKFKPTAEAASFNHSGMVSVFFTARLLYFFRYSEVSQIMNETNSFSSVIMSLILEGSEIFRPSIS